MRLNSTFRGVVGRLTLTAAAVMAAGCATTGGMSSAGKEYVLTVTRPGHLQVIDAQTHEVVRRCEIPGRFGSGAMAPAPDGRTVFVLSNAWEDVYGFEVETCKIIFSAKQSEGNITVKSFQSVAVSADGKELYTIQNPTEQLKDRYRTHEPKLAVYNIADGLNAKPVRTFPVPRRISKIAATKAGEVILGGGDIQAINTQTGEIRMVTALQNWDRGPLWLPPDAFAMHSQGEHVNEYVMPYTTAKFESEEWDFDKAEWWWGMSRVDLNTGKVEAGEVFPFEGIVFTMVSDPRDRNIFYGAFNDVTKHDLTKQATVATEPLPRTYYSINIVRDGSKVFIGGGGNDISVYSTDTLKPLDRIYLSGDMATADVRIVQIKR